MIANLVIQFFGWVFSHVLGSFPTVPVPSWLSSAGGAISSVFAFADSMSVWFPTGLALTVLGALVVIKGTGFLIKVLRMAVSLMTGGGGSAA